MSDTIKKHVKDPGSAITHFIGMLMAVFAAVPLIIKATHEPSPIYVVSIAIYAASLILLYAASTTYHTFDRSEKVITILKKIRKLYTYLSTCTWRKTWNHSVGYRLEHCYCRYFD